MLDVGIPSAKLDEKWLKISKGEVGGESFARGVLNVFETDGLDQRIDESVNSRLEG